MDIQSLVGKTISAINLSTESIDHVLTISFTDGTKIEIESSSEDYGDASSLTVTSAN